MSANRGSRPRGRSSDVERLRMPPQSVDAEQSVLGGMMLAPDTVDLMRDLLKPSDFYRRDHQLIFQSILELDRKGKPCDAVTLGEWFDAQGLSEQIAGGAYLVELASTTPSAANIKAYAEIVRDKAILRAMIEAGTETVNDGFDPKGVDTPELLALAERRLSDIANGHSQLKDHSVSLRRSLSEAFSVIQDRYQAGGQVTGLATGYSDLDDLTTGLQPTDLIILAARPSQGKTTLALNIAEHAAVKKNTAVMVFSMEMSNSQLSIKMLSSHGRINVQRLRTGQLLDEDWGKLSESIKVLRDAKVFIDDSPGLSPDELRARAKRKKREENIGLIVVDYLQLMQVPSTKENRATEISEISRSLKAIAKELNVPVIALSQLNRAVEARADKRPMMSDLRESGSIEQDADVIMFIYRDEYYNKDSPDKGTAELIIAKQRNGPTGMVRLKFFGEHSRFDALAQDAYGEF